MPNEQVDSIVKLLNENNAKLFGEDTAGDISQHSIDALKQAMVLVKQLNPICSTCHTHGNMVKLKLCTGCSLVYYCNKDCQRKDWKHHKSTCLKKDQKKDQNKQ